MNLRRPVAVIALALILGSSALAGETSSPPCAPVPPGEMNSPPCDGSQQLSPDNSDVLSQSVSSDSITLTEYAATEVTIGLLQSALSLL